MEEEKFTEDYYLNGIEKGLSNYENYSWRPDQTLPMVDHVSRFLEIKFGDSLLDFGMARGYAVKAFRMRGIKAVGFDISKWAVENCDHGVKDYVINPFEDKVGWDFLYSKDVLEHISEEQLCIQIPELLKRTRRKALFIVPLTLEEGGEYINPLDEKDSTHIVRSTLETWLSFLQKMDHSFIVSCAIRVPMLKVISEQYPGSSGFFTLHRI